MRVGQYSFARLHDRHCGRHLKGAGIHGPLLCLLQWNRWNDMLILKRLKWYPLNFSIAYLSEQKSGGPSELHVAGRVVRKELYGFIPPYLGHFIGGAERFSLLDISLYCALSSGASYASFEIPHNIYLCMYSINSPVEMNPPANQNPLLNHHQQLCESLKSTRAIIIPRKITAPPTPP